MKSQKYKQYIYWGITAAVSLITCIIFVILFFKAEEIRKIFYMIQKIMAPITYGAIMAYLMTPIYNRLVGKTKDILKRHMKNEKQIDKIARMTGCTASLLLIIIVVIGLISMMMPQLVDSIVGIAESLPYNVNVASNWLENWLTLKLGSKETIINGYDTIVNAFNGWLRDSLIPNMNLIASKLSNSVISIIVVLKNLLIGLIVMVYVLSMKEVLSSQAKKITYSLFSLKNANRIIEKTRFIHKIFCGFIVGKLLDSLIIGIICFFCMTFMNMPYILLISVIVGVTNIIPFFGPFIGAVPSALLILFVSPMKCIYFLIFILILQQFDGNILGPKILGNSTGLPGFWVLFSILIFGGLLGPVGMIVGVPAFAVIYQLIKDFTSSLLRKKGLSSETSSYHDLDHIDEETGNYLSQTRSTR